MYNRCFFYVIDKEEYLPLIALSIESLIANMDDCDRFVVATSDIDLGDLDARAMNFDRKLLWSPSWYFNFVKLMPLILKTLGESYGMKKAIYLDCDTFLCYPVYDLFFMLDYVDMMGAQSPRRYTQDTRTFVPDAFPEWGIGVNPMRTSERVVDFWNYVLGNYAQLYDELGNDDQKPLRLAMWNYIKSNRIDVKFHTLTPEYNFRFNYPCFAATPVSILHGKSKYIRKVAQIVNEREGFRAWEKGINLE